MKTLDRQTMTCPNPGGRVRLAECVTILAIFALCYGALASRLYTRWTFTAYDAGWQLLAAESLRSDGDLDLRNQLERRPERAHDQTARGFRGEWYPVHEILLPIVTVPFLSAFSFDGCLYLNLVVDCLIQLLAYLLARRHVEPAAALAAVSVTGLATPFLRYSYGYSGDLFGTLLFAAALLATVAGRPRTSGLCCGFAVLGRLGNAVVAPLFLLAAFALGGTKAAARFIAGALPGLAWLAAANRWMFGGALETSYNHWQVATPHGWRLVDQSVHNFTRPLLSGLHFELTDAHIGVLATAPALPLVLVPGIFLLARRSRVEAALAAGTSAAFLLLFARYTGVPYIEGTFGNRYLLPIAVCCTAPLALVFERIQARTGAAIAESMVREVDEGVSAREDRKRAVA